MARILMKGNEAMAEAAIQAGCQAFFGYPITPQSEIPEYFARELPPRGGLFLQAESEMAAMNMVMGASAAGGRVMTMTTSCDEACRARSVGTAASGVPAKMMRT